MAASMWRMNGLCGSMAGVLLLCTLMFSSEVMSQSPDTDVPGSQAASTVGETATVTDASTAAAVPQAEAASQTSAASGEPAAGKGLDKMTTPDNNVVPSPTLKTTALGLTKIETPQSSSTSVLWGILVSGLLVAIGIIVWYFKCQRKPGSKGARLAEEAYPVDQENQGNTLVSEAPLNPPSETQEKPNVNGESPEADKTPTPPPTNGSTAKTADTGL